MKFIDFLRSSSFALFAVGAWMMSFLIITGSQAHNNVSYVILIIPALISLSVVELKAFFRNKLVQLLCLVIASLVLAACVGDGDPLKQIKFGMIVLLFFIAVSRLPLINNDTAYRFAWIFLVLLMVYVSGNAIRQYIDGAWAPGMRLDEMHAKLENVIYVTNTMGGMLAIITLLGIQQSRYKEVIIAHITVLFYSLVLLQTRSIIGIWLATMLLTYCALYQHKFKNLRTLITVLLVALVMCIGIFSLVAFTSIGEQLQARNFYRPEIWSGYISETLRCGVWFGCGTEHDFTYVSHDGHEMVHPHSVFITQFYKAGIVGFLPLILLTILASINGYKTRSWAGWYFIVGALGVCFDGSSLVHSPSQRWLVFHLPLALLIAQQLHQQHKANISDGHLLGEVKPLA